MAIDETPASRVARDLAIAIAKRRGAPLIGSGSRMAEPSNARRRRIRYRIVI